MARKIRIVRSIDERIEAMKLKLDKMESRKDFIILKIAIRDGRVSKGNLPQYRKALREATALEKASSVLVRHKLESAAEDVRCLRQDLIFELESLLTKPSKSKKVAKKSTAKKSTRKKSTRKKSA